MKAEGIFGNMARLGTVTLPRLLGSKPRGSGDMPRRAAVAVAGRSARELTIVVVDEALPRLQRNEVKTEKKPHQHRVFSF